MLRRLIDYFRSHFGYKEPSVEEAAVAFFPDKDVEAAVAFYKPWHQAGWLRMDRGDESWELDRQSFFRAASITFEFPPFLVDGWVILGMDQCSDMGTLMLKPGTGEVYYVYEDYELLLTSSFTEFVQEMQNAGWKPPR